MFSVVTFVFCCCCCWSCLLYQHLPVTRFLLWPWRFQARHFLLDGEPRPLAVRQPNSRTQSWWTSGREVRQPFLFFYQIFYHLLSFCWKPLATIVSHIQVNLEDLPEMLIKGVLSSLVQAGLGSPPRWAVGRLVFHHFLYMAGNMSNLRIFFLWFSDLQGGILFTLIRHDLWPKPSESHSLP